MSEFTDRAQAKREAEEAKRAQEAEPAKRARKSLLASDPPERDAGHGELAAWVTVALGVGSDPIASATRYGRHLDARMVVTLKSGDRVTFERQADIFDARKLVNTCIASTGADMPHYGPGDAQKIATVLVRLSGLASKDDDRDEATDWAYTFLRRAQRNTIDVETFNTPEGRWEALSALEQFTPPADLSTFAAPAERAVVVRAASGRRLVRVSDVGAHVRGESSHPMSWPALHARLVEIGWEHPGRIQQRQPGGHLKLKARVFAIPADWENE